MSELLKRNHDSLLAKVAAACQRAGRDPDSVQLIAVTKYAQIEWVKALVALGQRTLGENRPQQLQERASEIPEAEWHLIGHLQRNKVRPVLPLVSLIHSVDSLKLLTRIGDIAGELNLAPSVLLEVNVSCEGAKDGFDPETVRQEWEAIQSVPNVILAGLMTMAPLSDEPERSRPFVRRLGELREELIASARQPALFRELSMGMSGDFQVAIEEGSTIIRVGTRLFAGMDDRNTT